MSAAFILITGIVLLQYKFLFSSLTGFVTCLADNWFLELD